MRPDALQTGLSDTEQVDVVFTKEFQKRINVVKYQSMYCSQTKEKYKRNFLFSISPH